MKTAREEGYRFIRYLEKGLAVFQEISIFQRFEVWAANKNHASFGFRFNNTDWEFVREYHSEQEK